MENPSGNNIRKNIARHHYFRHLQTKRHAVEVEGSTVAVVALVVILVAIGMGYISLGIAGSGNGSNKGNTNNSSCSTISQQTAEQLKFTAAPFNGGDALSSPVASVYSSSTNWATLGGDNPGSLSSAFTTGGAYSLQSGLVADISATGAYPVWAPLNGQPFTQAGVTTVSVLPQPGSVANTCVWGFAATPIFAGTSPHSSTTNVQGFVSSSQGLALSTAATKMPQSQDVWTNVLQMKDAYSGAGYPENVVSTQGATVVNYQTGQTVPLGGSQLFQTVLVISCNCTNLVLGLDQSAAGLQMAPITNAAQTVGSSSWVIWGFQGCAPTGSTDTATTCLSAPVDIYQNNDPASGHSAVTAIWADMQQPSYVIAHFTNPGLTSYPAAGAAAGLPTSFSFFVPTANPNSGAPTVLVTQSYTAILAEHT